MSTQVTFTPEQAKYLRDWFSQQSKQYVTMVMDDEFDADEENFERLCDSTFNVDGFKIGQVVGRDNVEKSVVKKGKKARKVKDPNAPKQPKSSYMFWLWSDNGVEQVKKDKPDISHKVAVSEASKIWNTMSEEDKTVWTDMNLKAKEEYESKMKDYNYDSSSGSSDSSGYDEIECPEGFEMKKGMYLTGYSKAGKTKYDTIQDAIDNIKDFEDVGGIVYDGKHYTIRKIGTPKKSSNKEILFIK